MTLNKKILQNYNKLYPTKQIVKRELENFQKQLNIYIDKINTNNEKNESEENLKSPFRDMLSGFGYTNDPYDINTNRRIDYVISKNDKVEVIIELKKPSNTHEMIDVENINKKAFHEALHYYFQEREENNLSVKHIIISNGLRWFIFDEKDIARLYSKYGKKYRQWSKDKTTNDIYKQFELWLEGDTTTLTPIAFDLAEYRDKPINELTVLYRILHPDFLLKEFHVRDANELNEKFYNELLYIMGLKENTKTRKIEIDKTIIGSLSYNIVYKLIDDKGFNPESEELNETTMELLITWINRILFLKLFEAQLVSFNRDNGRQGRDYRFLTIEKIPNYDTLKDYFFEIFGKSIIGEGNTQRRDNFRDDFYDRLPYLNSSLFEVSDLETQTIHMSNLDDNVKIKNYGDKKDINTLEYLFEFLDKYDFSSENNHHQEIIEEKKEDVSINPSVLGLIFEKLNGYKDGSFYTPGFITSYITRETIERAVIEKFNDKYKKQWKSLVDIKNNLDYSSENLREYNRLINSLKICDPAVGSGHFLVSALNTLLHIKSELGILCDYSIPPENKKELSRSRVNVKIENDILVIYDDKGEQYKYKRGDKEHIQEMIFHEKKALIENCLFGVDINANSAHICRLRLWIELLKNTHYLTTNEDDHEMEILPNIDINIKVGNSLISKNRVAVEGVSNVKVQYMKRYKELVAEYKNTSNKDIKKNIKIEIKKIKDEQLDTGDNTMEGLEMDTIEEKKKGRNIYENAMEWTLEFPEVLSNNGMFQGFDVVVGNPPYIRHEEIKEFKKNFGEPYSLATNTSDLYVYFYELAYRLMKRGAFFGFITSNKWMRTNYGIYLREFLANKVNLLSLVDFGGHKVFASATVDTNITLYQKKHPQPDNEMDIMDAITGKESFETTKMKQSYLSRNNFVLEDKTVLQLKAKIEKIGKPLKDWDVTINRGVLTGYNEAFIIDGEKKKELIAQDPQKCRDNQTLLRGRDINRYSYDFADKWLINSHNGIKDKNIEPIDIVNDYPSIYKHLLQYEKQCIQRQDQGNHWTNLRSCAYLEDFNKEKVVWQETSQINNFCYDNEKNYCDKTSFIMTGDNIKYLMGLINSKLCNYQIMFYIPKLGKQGRSMGKEYVEQLPIPEPTPEQEAQMVSLVDKMLSNPDDRDTDTAIDALVYQLYDLTPEEIEIVSGSISK